jgi:hypothetical protein
MSSRQEEKQRRREERLAAERAAAESAARRKRMGLAVGGLLVAAAVAAVIVAVTAGGGGGTKSSKPAKPNQAEKLVLAKAQAAGCQAQTFPMYGRTHVDGKVKYQTNPPTSGNHNPVPASDGIYDPGGTPQVEKLVHAMEHGRIEFQYRPGLPAGQRVQLEGLMKEAGMQGRPAGYNQLLFQNTTQMPYAVAATAWTHLIGCPRFAGEATLNALRAFRDAYTDKGPELIQAPE